MRSNTEKPFLTLEKKKEVDSDDDDDGDKKKTPLPVFGFMVSASQPVDMPSTEVDQEMKEEKETRRRANFGFMTPAANASTAQKKQASSAKRKSGEAGSEEKSSPITKLELNKSRRKLTFADCAEDIPSSGMVVDKQQQASPSFRQASEKSDERKNILEEASNGKVSFAQRVAFDTSNAGKFSQDVAGVVTPKKDIEEEDDDLILKALLEPTDEQTVKELGKQNKVEDLRLGTPGSVLGIHSKNALAKQPKNRQERVEMRNEALGIRKLRSRKENIIPGRNKDLAPNGIKKTPTKKANKTINLRKSPRKGGRRVQTSAKKPAGRQSEIG